MRTAFKDRLKRVRWSFMLVLMGGYMGSCAFMSEVW